MFLLLKLFALMIPLVHTPSRNLKDCNRFDSYLPATRKPDTCWIWEGGRGGDGYGRFWMEKKNVSAHRAAVLRAGGEIPEGKFVTHSCDNPLCVNPAHLKVTTHARNMQDMVTRKRHAYGEKNPVAVLTEVQCRTIIERIASGATVRGLAREMGINRGTLRNVAKGYTWRHLRCA
jgi:hypothetical protein